MRMLNTIKTDMYSYINSVACSNTRIVDYSNMLWFVLNEPYSLPKLPMHGRDSSPYSVVQLRNAIKTVVNVVQFFTTENDADRLMHSGCSHPIIS